MSALGDVEVHVMERAGPDSGAELEKVESRPEH